MHFPETSIENLRGFGYTEDEARFVYLVATHSGYFSKGTLQPAYCFETVVSTTSSPACCIEPSVGKISAIAESIRSNTSAQS